MICAAYAALARGSRPLPSPLGSTPHAGRPPLSLRDISPTPWGNLPRPHAARARRSSCLAAETEAVPPYHYVTFPPHRGGIFPAPSAAQARQSSCLAAETEAVSPCHYVTFPYTVGGIFLLSLRGISPTLLGNLPCIPGSKLSRPQHRPSAAVVLPRSRDGGCYCIFLLGYLKNQNTGNPLENGGHKALICRNTLL